jgi:cytochrome b561
MREILKTLRLLQWGMLVSIVLYAGIGEAVGLAPEGGNPSLSYAFTTLGVAIVGIIFVVRRTLVLRTAESLAAHPDDGLSLRHWKNGYIATYVLCEALGLFGLVLRCTGFNFQQSVPFYIGAFVLLFFFAPREPVSA